MSTIGVCGLDVAVAHELWLKMSKAGFTPSLVQEVINSPGNQKAQMMLTALQQPPKTVRKAKPKFKLNTDGTVEFTVKSDGTTGSGWITKLEGAGHKLGKYAKQLLLSTDFKPTKGIVTKIVVLPGRLWSDNERSSRNTRTEATNRALVSPNAEVACLMRMMFSNEDIRQMGLRWLIAMHEPIKDTDGDPLLLGTDDDEGVSWLGAFWGRLDAQWRGLHGFAFAVSQV
jgi:hypothetical protein